MSNVATETQQSNGPNIKLPSRIMPTADRIDFAFRIIRQPKVGFKLGGSKPMHDSSTEYICMVNFDHHLPDEYAWRSKLIEFGLDHEAFTFSQSPTGRGVVKFWERDRPEALRILAKLDGIVVSPQF